VRLPVRLLTLAVAVAGRAEARRGPAALARATGVRSASLRALAEELSQFDSLGEALLGGGHHVAAQVEFESKI